MPNRRRCDAPALRPDMIGGAAEPEPKPSPARTTAAKGKGKLETITVTGSNIRRGDIIEHYNESTVVQTGAGEPGWNLGSRYCCAWSGPVLPRRACASSSRRRGSCACCASRWSRCSRC